MVSIETGEGARGILLAFLPALVDDVLLRAPQRKYAGAPKVLADGAPAVHLVRAVSFYRSKFLDCLRGAVANSYPNVDLLWDNVITGPWGVSDSQSLVVVGWPRADHGGRS
jgi:hypothetical protein